MIEYNQTLLHVHHQTLLPSSQAWTRFLSQSKCSEGGGEDGGGAGGGGDDGDGACGEGGAGDGGVGVSDGGGGGVGGFVLWFAEGFWIWLYVN